jgi:hypothetical protein
MQCVVRNETPWEFVSIDACRARKVLAFAKAHKVIAPCHHFACRIDAALQEMESGRTIEVVAHVVFACPEELYRTADELGNPGRLDHVIVVETASETAAEAGQMNRDVTGRNAERL